jgi:hypothetical protein
VQVFRYNDRDVETLAIAAISDRAPFDFLVDGKKGRLIRDAVPLWNTVFSRDVGLMRRFLLGTRLCGYVIRTPHFWPIYSHARRARMHVTVTEHDDEISMSFRS